MCPKGDDPITLNQFNRKFRLAVSSSNSILNGNLGIEFGDSTAYISIGSGASDSNCEAGLVTSGKFSQVACTHTQISSYSRQFEIEVLQWPLYGGENNLFFHRGNPLITSFYCDITQTNPDTICTFTDIVNYNLKGNLKYKYYIYNCNYFKKVNHAYYIRV